jgi:hypothetical protein
MSLTSFRSSRPDSWNNPRPHTDPSQRYMKYGPIRPMDEDRSLFWRFLFGR